MRILFLDQIGKINSKYSVSLCKGLEEEGLDVTLATNETSDIKDYDKTEIIWEDYSKVNKIKKLFSYLSSYRRTVKYIRENNIDIFHVQWLIFSPVDYYYLKKIKKNGVKIVVTVHDVLPFNKKFYDFKYHNKIYNMANHVIAQASENVKILTNDFNLSNNNLSMIPHGHFMDYADIVDSKEAREHLGLGNENILLFFGQIKKVKGLDYLIKAFAKVVKSYPNTKLVIAGKVWKDSFDYYEEIINEYRLKNKVVSIIEYIPDEDIKYYFSAADIVVLPYKMIYQSGVVQLAYAYAKGVVATNIGGFKDTIIDGKTGYLVECENVDSIAEGIEKFLNNPSSIAEFGREGKKYLTTELSWEKICSEIKRIYELVEEKR